MDPIAKSDEIKRCKDAIFHGKKKVTEVHYMIRQDSNSRELAALGEKAQQELNKLYERLRILTVNQHQGPRNDPDQPAPRPTTKSVVSADSSPEKTQQKNTDATQPDEDMNVDDFIPQYNQFYGIQVWDELKQTRSSSIKDEKIYLSSDKIYNVLDSIELHFRKGFCHRMQMLILSRYISRQ
ncbi:hypothetical protein HNY73_004446 [Argiope bruennichi]|uniref:Uncharacterized protein n=1 Tax=Argiope bruennichi TaxID=94029 RepID=A0A8T0FQ14_ARGBR|nr:hypothetical protein HNY73_004446 [Argiope bruennichi]